MLIYPKHIRYFICMIVLGSLVVGCGHSDTPLKNNTGNSLSNNESLTIRLARVTEAGGNVGAAEKLYKQAVEQSGNAVFTRLELAEFYKRHNNNAGAISALKDASDSEPNNTDILRDLANTYINADQPDKALSCLDKAITITPNNALLYNSKGVALDSLGQYSEAQKSYEKAVELNPNDRMTFDANLSMSYILSGEYDTAIGLLRPLLNASDVTPTIRQNLALAYGFKGESDKALKLGLKDLTPEQAEENVKFYRLAAAQNKHKAPPKTMHVENKVPAAAPAPQEDEEYPPSAELQNPMPLKTAATLPPEPKPAQEIKESPAPISTVSSSSVASIASKATDITLPIPVLKPDRL